MKLKCSSSTIIALTALLAMDQAVADPRWWTEGTDPPITSDAPANYAPANLGQAKWMAKSALEALRRIVPSLADDIEADLVGTGKPIPSWSAPTPGSDLAKAQFAPLLIGQLKAVAAPFYDHLYTFAPTWLGNQLTLNETSSSGSHYPWSTTTSDDNNYGAANLGQLKAAFALNFIEDYESGEDRDTIPDLWEYGVLAADAGVHWTTLSQINLNNVESISSMSSSNPLFEPPNTLAINLAIQIDSRIAGLTASTSLPMFTTKDYTNNVYVRNTSFWAHDLVQQLTCISPANSTGAANGNWGIRAGTVLTRRHVLQCNHLVPHMAVGDTIRFVTASDSSITRTVSDVYEISGKDYIILLLDSDLPNSITSCKIGPADLNAYFPHYLMTGSARPRIPVMKTDQEKKGFVHDLSSFWPFTGGRYGIFGEYAPDSSQRLLFWETTVMGDSGSPTFMITDDEMFLVGTAVAGDSGQPYPGTALDIEDINSAISELNTNNSVSGAYPLTVIDLSSFPKYW